MHALEKENGSPLQCSCLENPRDREARWAAVCGIAQLNTTDVALNKRELIKLTVLENCDETAKDLCDKICRALNAEPIQCIGRKIVIYRQKPEEEK